MVRKTISPKKEKPVRTVQTAPLLKQEKKGRLAFIFTEDSFRVDLRDQILPAQEEKLRQDFLTCPDKALYQLGFSERQEGESPSLGFLRFLSGSFYKELTDRPELELARDKVHVELTEDAYDRLLMAVPFGNGTEWIGKAWIKLQFARMNQIYREEIRDYDGTVQMYLAEKDEKLVAPERVFFHLVENSASEQYPFAFIATYATKAGTRGIKHKPLSYALQEFDGKRTQLVALLSCLNKAAEVSPLIAEFMTKGEMFHPLRLTKEEAWTFLKDVERLEEVGILCRVPNWWKKRYSQMHMNIRLGEEQPSMFGFDALIGLVPELLVDGEPLTKEEIRQLLAQTEGLTYLKGKWVVLDHARLEALLKQMEKYEGQMSLVDALRMEAGIEDDPDPDIGVSISNGKWLSGLLSRLRQPASLNKLRVPRNVTASLRPYQKTGYQWLHYMQELGFGACLADDMGLGKTLQVLTWLSQLRKEKPDACVLLIVPASLLGNWQKEAEKFTPDMPFAILHGTGAKAAGEQLLAKRPFLTITTYGMAARLTALSQIQWTEIILDEAQAIKNPGTKQTRAIKSLQSAHRVAMTGTPIENDLGNLWSLFDFLNKGLLGTSDEFRSFTGHLEQNPEGYQKLKSMVAPFILRRLKTDRRVIADLPDKMEMVDYAGLSRQQIVLYRQLVNELERVISEVEGMQRRGIILAYITKFKQICNHPDQYLGQDAYVPAESGKFEMLREICETISEKREKVLVFTQYREITDQLSMFLNEIFGAKGLVLHGGVPPKTRTRMVEQFNNDEYIPYMVLSVKAGGTGLNLTAANHVIHFDRWWNPAVENQATDRAFRIGQKKNVMVHKLVCKGTIEERIDDIINSKKKLAENVIGGGGENWITEMNNNEIMDLMRLRI